jgi:hypothetical protein
MAAGSRNLSRVKVMSTKFLVNRVARRLGEWEE